MESSVKPLCLVGILLVLVAEMLENHSAGSLLELNMLKQCCPLAKRCGCFSAAELSRNLCGCDLHY